MHKRLSVSRYQIASLSYHILCDYTHLRFIYHVAKKKIHFTYHINLFENTLLSSYRKPAACSRVESRLEPSQNSARIYILDSDGSLYVHMTGTSSMIVCMRKLHARISLYFLISINYVF